MGGGMGAAPGDPAAPALGELGTEGVGALPPLDAGIWPAPPEVELPGGGDDGAPLGALPDPDAGAPTAESVGLPPMLCPTLCVGARCELHRRPSAQPRNIAA